MRKATDTALRYLALLQLIPAYPYMLSVEKIQQKLLRDNADYEVDIRTIQRDLEKLSAEYSLSRERKGRTDYWFWSNKHTLTQIPAMDESTALAFKLAEDHLEPLIPPATRDLLKPYFEHATRLLQKTKLGKWSEKTCVIGRGPELIVPAIKQDVQEVVYQALLEGQQFEVAYQTKGHADAQCYTLNPLGIVFKNGIVYLVATAWNYEDPRHYVLHRMSHAKLLEQPVKLPPNFDLARHIKTDKEFSYPLSNKKIKLRALFSNYAAIHLTESKLSDDQKAINKGDGQMLIEATVADTAELRWWLLGFGGSVKVLGPSALRKEFSEFAEEMRHLYKK